MGQLPMIRWPWRGRRVFGKFTFALLLFIAIGVGICAGLLFVYGSDLPEIRALEDYRPSEPRPLKEFDRLAGDAAPSRALANANNFGGVAEGNLRGRHRMRKPVERGCDPRRRHPIADRWCRGHGPRH